MKPSPPPPALPLAQQQQLHQNLKLKQGNSSHMVLDDDDNGLAVPLYQNRNSTKTVLSQTCSFGGGSSGGELRVPNRFGNTSLKPATKKRMCVCARALYIYVYYSSSSQLPRPQKK